MKPLKKLTAPVPALAATAALLLVAGCGGGGSDSGAKTGTTPATQAATGSATDSSAGAAPDRAAAGAIRVALAEYHFTPGTIKAKAGPVTLSLVNQGVVPHDLVVMLPSGAKKSAQITPGATTTFDVGDLKPGTYKIHCDLPGHTESGMVGTLVVQ